MLNLALIRAINVDDIRLVNDLEVIRLNLTWKSDNRLEIRDLIYRYDEYLLNAIEILTEDKSISKESNRLFIELLSCLTKNEILHILRNPILSRYLIDEEWRKYPESAVNSAFDLFSETITRKLAKINSPKSNRIGLNNLIDEREIYLSTSSFGNLDRNSISIDNGKKNYIPLMNRGGNSLFPYSRIEVDGILLKLHSSFREIFDTSQAAHHYTFSFTEALFVRKELEFPEKFSSGSFRRHVGLSLLCNPHLESVSISDCASSIVHEAIHSNIYMAEAFGQTITDASSNDLSCLSPWSGSLLNLDSFIQACFVWFGLFNYWRLSELKEESKDTIEFITKGFASLPSKTVEKHMSNILTPDVVDIIRSMEAEAKYV
ncbi:MAG: hypothetical protein AB2799_14025 [Candidatus Thiodiazotropha sp.]